MKRYITLVFLSLNLITTYAQDKVGINFAQNFTTFRFKDSENNIEDLDYAIKYGYGLFYQKVFNKHFIIEGSLSYNNKGATSTNDLEKLDWSFHYANAGINAGYKLIFGRLCPQLGAGLFYGRLLQADQYIGTEYYDLMAANTITKNDWGVIMFAGLEYEYSDNGSIYVRFNEAMGLMQLETNEEGTQKMFNRTFSIQLGLSFNINLKNSK